ncbi:MAG TPA: hypothetical protein PLP17_12395, partial [Oligoflexia bacterium]|nr:hypothetical protein [Oligoflexia bacterium]
MDELNRLLSKLLGPDGEVSPEVLRQIADIGPRAGPALVRALLDSQRHNAAAAAIEHLPELTLEHLAQRLQGNPCGAENEECRLAGCFAISAIIVEMWELAKAEERQEVLARLSNFAVTALLREPARGCSAGRAAKHRVLLDMGWDLLP